MAAGQEVPTGYYNIGTMAQSLVKHGAEIGSCGTCMNARGLTDDRMITGAQRSSMAELGRWTAWADTVINI